MIGFVIYHAYEVIEGRAYVFLYGRLENGESFVTINKFQPYFYIKESDLSLAEELAEFEYENTNFKNFKGEKVLKIILNIPHEVPELRKKFEENSIECYEADIRFPYRFMMDRGIQGSIEISGDYEPGDRIDRVYKEPEIKGTDYKPNNLKVLSFDIESSKGTEDDIIYCIGYVCNENKKVFINSKEEIKGAVSCKNEAEVIEKFFEDLINLDPDVITGWNVIDFDLNYLHKKCRKLKIPFDFGRKKENVKLRIEESFFRDSKVDVIGRQVMDALSLMKVSFIKVEDYKLDTVAKKILGDTKLITATGIEKFKEIDNLWKNNKEKLTAYNLKDAELVIRIIEKTKILDLTILRSLLTGMPLDRVNASIASFDSLYIRESMKRNIVVPTGKYSSREERIKGGYVREGTPGIYDYVLVLDFKSLYPSIMRTFNIDPYSYVPDCKGKNLIKAPNGACFRNEKGTLPEILEKLYHEREKAIKEKDNLTKHAIKILSNSFFGLLANPACRFYDVNMTNAITYFGQHILKLTHEEINKVGYKIVYGDSITKDRFVTLLINNQIVIKNIEELFNDYSSNIKKKGDKDFIDLSRNNIKALTLNYKTIKSEFSKLTEVIRHKTDKKVYRINQKYGETICTEDHSIVILKDGKLKEVKPKELNNNSLINVKYCSCLKKIDTVDLYPLLNKYKIERIYKGRKKVSEAKLVNDSYLSFGWMNRKKPIILKRFINVGSKDFDALCRLLGVYVAEGSSSTPETTKTRLGASISSSNTFLLKQLQRDYCRLFKNVKVSIIKSTKKERKLIYYNKGQRKKVIYKDNTYKLQLMNILSAVFFKMLCGQKSHSKKLPEFIYHAPNKYKECFLKYMILGDGCRRENDNRYSNSYKKQNFSYNTSSLQLISGLSFVLGQLGVNYSLQYRHSKKNYTIQTCSKNNIRLNTKIEEINYKGYVYDLNVENNHMFVDACGQILLHNTDSNFVVSNAKNIDEADKIGMKIEKHINEFYKNLVKKEYNRESFLQLNYDRCFVKFLMPKLRKSDVGAKKRYAGLVIKDRKEEIQFTGLEFIRTDWTELAKKYQHELLDRIFHDKEIINFTKKFVENTKSGEYDNLLVYKKNIRKELGEYTKITPPHVKAARKLSVLDSSKIEYVMTEDGPEPLQSLRHKIDYQHYINKQIKPIADSVLIFFNTDFESLMKGSRQMDLTKF